ncbi:MAG: DUF1289 domain-containing protein [Gammaproteobacteria bacterium]|nr:DUF1289 domain-containing protein [Gammaproteobacteria bacterium]MDE2263277.1 DUF1289 domain-containing protein [Gammaproteobacteria bacterium]
MSEAQAPAEWDRPRSPCTRICSLDEQGYCIGCLRTADEIGRWTSMSAAEQWQVIAELKRRRELARGGGVP